MTSAIFLFVFLISAAATPEADYSTHPAKPFACRFFTYANAEKLLGQEVVGVESEENKADGSQRWNCTFTGANGESKLYFALFKEAAEEIAKADFRRIRESNRKHPGFEDWPGMPDEALVHTDGANFQFVMVRKGTRTIRIKVNPAKGTSIEDVRKIAVSLVEKLK